MRVLCRGTCAGTSDPARCGGTLSSCHSEPAATVAGRVAGFVGVKMASGEVVYSHSALDTHLPRHASAAGPAGAAARGDPAARGNPTAPTEAPRPMLPLQPVRFGAARELADLSSLAAAAARRGDASGLTAAAAASPARPGDAWCLTAAAAVAAATAAVATVTAAAIEAPGARTALDGFGDAGVSTGGRQSELTSILQPLRLQSDGSPSTLR